MSTMEIVLSVALIALVLVIAHLLQSHADRKKQLKRFQKLVDLESEQKKIEVTIHELHGARVTSQNQVDGLAREKSRLEGVITELQARVQSFDDDLMFQEHGLYEPRYNFGTAKRYKTEIDKIRKSQKTMISEKTAVLYSSGCLHSVSMRTANKYFQLILRAFNLECKSIISTVNYNNVVSKENRIYSTYKAINKLGRSLHCEINHDYLDLKCEELRLVHEYRERLQYEKEESQRIRDTRQDADRANKEIQKARSEAERETARYEKALAKARREVKAATSEMQAELQAEVDRLNGCLLEAQANKERAISRAQLTRSGHVYILSNIGAFGENVYKIGMTRRLEPEKRVNELSGSAVPFRYDVHAMIYADDAPALETLLHNKLKHRSVNRINSRKEFFSVTLDEIEEILIINTDADVDMIRIPPAEEFRKTQAIIAEEQLESEEQQSA